MMKTTPEHYAKKNLVNRDFDRVTPYKVLLVNAKLKTTIIAK